MDQEEAALRQSSLELLAPKFRAAVEAALADLRAHSRADAYVFETLRSDALQKLYYQQGASRAESALSSWHGYGLAIDVVSYAYGWDFFPGGARHDDNSWWWIEVYSTFKAHGLDAGADWATFKDYPHFQWGTLKASPSARARELFAAGGLEAVWKEVGAL